MSHTLMRGFRIALLLWLAGWLIKLPFLGPFFGSFAFAYPIEHPLFPAVFCAPWTSWLAYWAPVVAGGAYLGCPTAAAARLAALVMTASSATLLLHINSYNDATFLTAFWAGVWMLWLSLQTGANRAAHVRRHAPLLATSIIALMFLGGAVGKLTPEYWNGEAVFNIYFLQKQYLPYSLLRAAFADDALRWIAMWASRVLVVVELLMAGVIFLPPRLALKLSVAVMLGIVAASTPWLFSVMGPLLAIAAASFPLMQAEDAPSSRLVPKLPNERHGECASPTVRSTPRPREEHAVLEHASLS